MSKAQELAEKVDYEGGLAETLMNYGGPAFFNQCPEAVQEEAKKAYLAFSAFENAWDKWLSDEGVENW